MDHERRDTMEFWEGSTDKLATQSHILVFNIFSFLKRVWSEFEYPVLILSPWCLRREASFSVSQKTIGSSVHGICFLHDNVFFSIRYFLKREVKVSETRLDEFQRLEIIIICIYSAQIQHRFSNGLVRRWNKRSRLVRRWNILYPVLLKFLSFFTLLGEHIFCIILCLSFAAGLAYPLENYPKLGQKKIWRTSKSDKKFTVSYHLILWQKLEEDNQFHPKVAWTREKSFRHWLPYEEDP